MARNSEKANAMLNKWHRIKSGITMHVKYNSKRPRFTHEVDDLGTAERWRALAVRDVMINLSRIQNASIGESAIRDLNDEINRLIGIRKKWDERIIELGGPDYRGLSSCIENAHGAELKVGGGGYRYFGAARHLPGVRELFEKQEREQYETDTYVPRSELYKKINIDYYGFGDEADGTLLAAEAELEAQMKLNNTLNCQ
ncbi:bifunctional Pre-mRNA-splicing factor Isy1/Helix hairpin bin domain superfamily/Pre-mRNA-splicing factor Isy1 superfamily [Babesia duncani]|uniref:Bifunctional Pre-mRNA-splicing factor Isy1/Helix hairpin bin domain superfamily/Pre-mRNA-splicing factor Isy1 superfamily n=1 Tax=Babesia duncani TaxID=323732 RepID=A0AAD9PI10_9APIC|nr:bifunctional Pre-mRNA-splicing factor Isy1/Helix hairpin bin domain superfamily/Pre-mRNA-splicing factor Isy1 superfamily [Babesia duncani]